MKTGNNKESLAVIVPIYNEEAVIEEVLNKWSAQFDSLNIDYQIHAYNDGSKDNTLSALRKIAAQNLRIIVHDKPNSGHGPSILQGYRENVHADWMFQVDSDDEMDDPTAFDTLWHHRGQYDFLIGRRDQRISPSTRRMVSAVARITIRLLYGPGVHDVNCPYRLMRTAVLRTFLSSIPANTFAPNVIITGIVCKRKFRVYETPVRHTIRKSGEVSIKNWKLIKAVCKSFWQTMCCALII